MRKIWLILVSAHCCLTVCLGQDTPSEGQVHFTLSDFLRKIESEYSVSFSYKDEIISDKEVSYHFHGLSSLDDILSSLQKQTVLKYQKLGEGYVVVRPFQAGDTLSISGQLIEKKGAPIPGAVIITDGYTRGAVSDSIGFFHIDKIPFNSYVSIHHVSFETRGYPVLEFIPVDTLIIFLEPAERILEELTISDYLTVGITKDRKDLTLFPDELKILPGLTEPDILQSIQQSPGVFSPYETATGIHVRGGSPDQNLVLWNGIKTYSQGHFYGMLSAFNPYITSEVKFIKNGTSSRYGDRVSSVIEIISSDEIPETLEGGAGANMLYSDVFLKVPVVKNKLAVSGSARRSFTDFYESFTYNQLSKRVYQNTKISEQNTEQSKNTFFFKDFTGNILFQPSDKSSLTFNAIYNRDDLNFISKNNQSGQSFQDILYTANNGFNLNYKQRLTPTLEIEASTYLTQYILQYEFRNTVSDTTETASKKNLINDFGGSLTGTYRINANQTVTAGIQTSNVNIRYAFENSTPAYRIVLDSDNPIVITKAVFTEYQFTKHRTHLSAGVRYNHYNGVNKFYVEPRVFGEYELAPKLKINASGEYRTQTTSQIKESVVSDLSLENQVWTQASEGKFPVITSYQGSVGLNYNRNGWLLDVEGYHKQIDGVTTLTFGFLNPIDNSFRKGDSKIYGTDLFVKKQLGSYKSWIGYTYLHTRNKFTGINNDKAFPGNWNIQHTLRWSHFYEVSKFQFSLGWVWHTGKSYTEVTSLPSEGGPITIQYGDLNGNNLPLYHRLDFSAIYETSSKKNSNVRYRLGLSVLNLYGRQNILNREFRTTPSLNNNLIDIRVYSLKVTPNLTFRVFW